MAYRPRSLLPPSAWAMAFCASIACLLPVAAQTVSLNAGGEQVRIQVGDSAVLPTDFPADLTLPQPHALVRVQHDGQETTIELDAAGDPDTVAAQFRAGMLINGWTAAPVGQPPTGNAQAWEKDARAAIAWLAPGTSGVRMQLRLQPRR